MPRILLYPLQALLVLFGLYNGAVLVQEVESHPEDTIFIAALAAATVVPLALAGGVAYNQRFPRECC